MFNATAAITQYLATQGLWPGNYDLDGAAEELQANYEGEGAPAAAPAEIAALLPFYAW